VARISPAVPEEAVPTPNEPNCGFDPVPISCGVAIVIAPLPLVIVILFVVQVKVAEVYPLLELPINKVPLLGVVVIPVPPEAIGKVPVVRAEVLVA